MSGLTKTSDNREEWVKSISNARADEQAEERDCTVVPADDYTLQLDIDEEEELDFVEMQVERLKHILKFEKRVTKSKSGNWHITLKMAEPMSIIERLMLQAMLGSDRVREILSYARYKVGEPQPIIFFEPKPKGLLPEGDFNVDEDLPF